jgi:hypothetical protein
MVSPLAPIRYRDFGTIRAAVDGAQTAITIASLSTANQYALEEMR